MAAGEKFGYAVERLAEATANRNAVLGNIAQHLAAGPGETAEQRAALGMEAQRAFQPTLQAIEDVAINVLGEVYREASDYRDCETAIMRADASWLYPVVLERALGAVGG